MKPLVVLAFGLLLMTTVGVGALLLRSPDAAPKSEIRDRLDALSSELVRLRSELDSIKTSGITPAQRDGILALIADARVEEQRQVARDEQQRYMQLALACAERAARKYDLTPDQGKGIVDVLLLSRDKLEAIGVELIEARRSQDLDTFVETINDAYRELKIWRLQELEKRVGRDIAAKLNEDDEFSILADAGRVEASRSVR